MTTFNWVISQLECHSQAGGQANVVFTVHWRLTGTDGTYDGTIYSTCDLPAPTDLFTPYEQLTSDQVLGWIWANGVDKVSAEAAVQGQIDRQANPPTVTPSLPWSN